MSLAVVLSRGLAGLNAPLVTVEVHAGNGLPAFSLVGLPETEVKEARDRVRAALQNAQFDFPPRKFTVNLAPADLPKDSGRFDLPIALGMLAATGQLPQAPLATHEFVGELALTGALRPIRGALAMTLGARRDGRAFVLPAESAFEAALVRDAVVYPATSLLAVCAHLAGREPIAPLMASTPVVAAGWRLIRSTSPTSRSEPGEASAHHRCGRCPQPAHDRPSRQRQVDAGTAPAGHPATAVRGRRPRDRRDRVACREILAGDMGHAAVPRAAPYGQWRRVGRRRQQSAAGRNLARPPRRAVPRRIAGVGSPGARGAARAARVGRDPHFARRPAVHVPGRVPVRRGDEPLSLRLARARKRALPLHAGAHRALPRPRVRAPPRSHRSRCRGAGGGGRSLAQPIDPRRSRGGHRRQQRRGAHVRCRCPATTAARQGKPNARLAPREVDAHCTPDAAGAALLAQAMARLSLSARAYHRILKVARTIADYADINAIGAPHIAEAIGYRRFDRI